MVKPLKPDEVQHLIPQEVIEVFNEMIAEKWDGHSALLFQDEVTPVVANKLGVSESFVYKKRWLDVEELFRAEGWVVVYDKPAYCEEYRPYFKFSRPKKEK